MSEFDRVARLTSENLDFGIASQPETIQMHLFTNAGWWNPILGPTLGEIFTSRIWNTVECCSTASVADRYSGGLLPIDGRNPGKAVTEF